MPIINENIDLDLYVMSIGFTIENKTVDVDVVLYSFVFFLLLNGSIQYFIVLLCVIGSGSDYEIPEV